MECLNCKNDALKGSDYCAACEEKELSKIGGWLYLPAIALIVNTILYSMYGFKSLKIFMDARDVLGELSYWLLLSAVLAFAFVLAGIYIGSLFFRKKSALPKAYIIWIILGLCNVIVDIAIAHYAFQAPVTFDDISSLGRGIISACIWIPYFIVSVRVKRTFVH